MVLSTRAVSQSGCTVAVAGATVHSGAHRLARLLAASRGDVQSEDSGFAANVQIEATPPGLLAVTSSWFAASQVRLLVVTPDEVELLAAFATIKACAQHQLLDAKLWIVAHRCLGLAEQNMVLGTLKVVCQRHLQFEIANVVAVDESRRRGSAITPVELLAAIAKTTRNNRLAA
jgi:MinD-like ATPase involved in chromosome partitioning or flagellar assembly